MNNNRKHNNQTTARQGAETVGAEPLKIGASTPIDFTARNLTAYGGLLPVATMLETLGLVEEVTRRGLIEPKFRIWDRASRDIIVEFDFGRLKDDTRFPYVVQCEQHKLAHMAINRLTAFPNATVEFSARVTGFQQHAERVDVDVESAGGTRRIAGSHLIGCDGGRSTIRKLLDIAFEGYTHSEHFLV